MERRRTTIFDVCDNVSRPGPNLCWPWTGTIAVAGYGVSQWEGRQWKAHRLVWTLVNGPIPDGLVVCHRCDNPPCVNPAHLFLGTIADNNRDRDTKGRAANRQGSRNTRARLTEADVIAIRADLRSDREIAEFYGMKSAAIGRIRRHQRWTHI